MIVALATDPIGSLDPDTASVARTRRPLTVKSDFIVIAVIIVIAGQKPIQGTRSLGVINDGSDDDDDQGVSSLTSRNCSLQ
jgi:hypothetical protein